MLPARLQDYVVLNASLDDNPVARMAGYNPAMPPINNAAASPPIPLPTMTTS